MTTRWLSIIGVGEDGRAGVSSAANALIDGAELIYGGQRHLDLIGATPGEQRQWPVPLDAAIPEIVARRGQPVAVLASGDPFWFGVGVTLARAVSADEMLVVPAPSSFSLAAARLGWALQDTTTLGLNMRGLLPSIRRYVHDRRRVLALSLNAGTPGQVAELLTANGFGGSRLTVLECLGGPRERVRSTIARDFAIADIDPLNIVAIEVSASPNARPLPFAAGLPDDLFENDGQLTKREIRAVTLSALAPGAGELLWDIGLGAGSVAIEWMLAHAANRAIGFERIDERGKRALRNAVALGAPHLDVRTGDAALTIDAAPQPDAVFLGGGADSDLIAKCWTALKPGGRIVANAVTLETEKALLDAQGRYGGTLTRISIDRADAVGSRLAWRPAMPVLQWAVSKSRTTS